ncbi:ubiquitin-specific protease [Saccharomycopsis crataegensis]|uniref:Ubiquitin thioesterase OTU n=1 Tax=Saccharomycopsis crataegensis TaxID=43959 RepID=A0AAV5QCN1_9ASCO|nr:ubiquitin-specific protease [Saccharomycopsis crataegensis]
MPIRLKCNFQGSSKVVSADPQKPLPVLLGAIQSAFNDKDLDYLINTGSVVLQHDYPKKNVDVILNIETTLEQLGFRSGEQVWLSDINKSASNPVAASSTSNSKPRPTETKKRSGIHTMDSISKKQKSEATSGSSKTYYEKIGNGYCVMRRMSDDNSCMFHAISYVLFGDADHVISLRSIVAEVLLENPTKYTKAYLGRPPKEYIEWITTTDAWGGAIELEIFANHFSIAIDSVDVKTGRVDSFIPTNTGDKEANFVVLYYSGVHYDALVYTEKDPVSPSEGHDSHIGVFRRGSALGNEVSRNAKKIGGQLNKDGYVTDMTNISVVCEQCGTTIVGESALLTHMKATGHSDFKEKK